MLSTRRGSPLSYQPSRDGHPHTTQSSLDDQRLSTHVKLQLLPQTIPMASCCAEDVLKATDLPSRD